MALETLKGVTEISSPEFFKKNKYVVVKNALCEEAAEIAGNSLIVDEAIGSGNTVDQSQVVGATSFYSSPICEAIMLQMRRKIEDATGLQLVPTYAFARVYRWGDDLKKHKDRPSCEISATLTLNFKSKELWPIWVKSVEGKDTSIELDIGDLMVYRGCEVEHWREPLNDGIWMQVFVHYIDRDGPYREYEFDKKLNKKPFYDFIDKYLVSYKGEK
jgi:hypothetical protein